MADAKKVPINNYNIELTLTEEEAQTLLQLTDFISGDPEGPRGHMDNIGKALEKAEMKPKSLAVGGCIHIEGDLKIENM